MNPEPLELNPYIEQSRIVTEFFVDAMPRLLSLNSRIALITGRLAGCDDDDLRDLLLPEFRRLLEDVRFITAALGNVAQEQRALQKMLLECCE